MTYSGPMSLLPELLKGPLRIASLFNASEELIMGRGDAFVSTIGKRNKAAPKIDATIPVTNRFFGTKNDIPNRQQFLCCRLLSLELKYFTGVSSCDRDAG